MRMSVCLLVCWFVCLVVCLFAYLRNHTAELHQTFVRVAGGRGSVFVWRGCDTLFTSGFVDDVIFSHCASCVFVIGQSVAAETTASFATKFCSAIWITSIYRWLYTEPKSATYCCLVLLLSLGHVRFRLRLRWCDLSGFRRTSCCIQIEPMEFEPQFLQ